MTKSWFDRIARGEIKRLTHCDLTHLKKSKPLKYLLVIFLIRYQ